MAETTAVKKWCWRGVVGLGFVGILVLVAVLTARWTAANSLGVSDAQRQDLARKFEAEQKAAEVLAQKQRERKEAEDAAANANLGSTASSIRARVANIRTRVENPYDDEPDESVFEK